MKIEKTNVIKMIVVAVVIVVFIVVMMIQRNKHPDDQKLNSIPLAFLLDMELNEKEETHYKKLAKELTNFIYEREFSISDSRAYTETIMRYLHSMLRKDYAAVEAFVTSDFWSEEESFINEMAYDTYHYDQVEFVDIDTNGQEIILHLKVRNENRYIVLDISKNKLTFDGYLMSSRFLNINFLYDLDLELDPDTYVDIDKIWGTFNELLREERAINRTIFSLAAYIEGMLNENHLLINSFTDYPHNAELANNIKKTINFFQTVKTYKVNITDVIAQDIDSEKEPSLDFSIVIELSFEKDSDTKSRTLLLEEHHKKITFTDVTNNWD